MSMRVNRVSLPSHRRSVNVPLFKHGVVDHGHTEYHADNLMKNSHFSFWNKLLFNIVDKVYPAMINLPRFQKHFVKITEKALAESNAF